MSVLQVTEYEMTHEGGTKQYHLTLIEDGAGGRGPSVLITRWGKTGRFGKWKAKMGHSSLAKNAMLVISEKQAREYKITRQSQSTLTEDQVARKLAPLNYGVNVDFDNWRDTRLGKGNGGVEHSIIGDLEETPTISKHYAVNPLWGTF